MCNCNVNKTINKLFKSLPNISFAIMFNRKVRYIIEEFHEVFFLCTNNLNMICHSNDSLNVIIK